MCVKSSPTHGLPPITRASSPPSGRARSRFSRIVLFRSQESSRASSRLWSCVLDIVTSVRCHHKRDGVCDSVMGLSDECDGHGGTWLTLLSRAADAPRLKKTRRGWPILNFALFAKFRVGMLE